MMIQGVGIADVPYSIEQLSDFLWQNTTLVYKQAQLENLTGDRRLTLDFTPQLVSKSERKWIMSIRILCL